MEGKDRVIRFSDILVLVEKISQEPTNQEEVRTREKLKEKLKKRMESLGEKQIGLIFWLGKKLVEGKRILYGAFVAAGMTAQPKSATIIIHKFWAMRKVTLRRMGNARLSLDDFIQLGLARLEIARNSSSPKIVYCIGNRQFWEAAKILKEQGNTKAAEILKEALPRSFNVPKEENGEKK